MAKRMAILHFVDAHSDKDVDFLIETDINENELSGLAVAIGNVKAHADDGESLSNFPIPTNWASLDWDEKVRAAVKHMETYVGRYTLLDSLKITSEVY
jgi:hypothetical protein